jgi:hypothetical protein
MEQAAQAWIDGIDLQVYAHDHGELQAYLGTLGTKAAGAYEDAVEETSSGRPDGSIPSGVRTKPSLREDESLTGILPVGSVGWLPQLRLRHSWVLVPAAAQRPLRQRR